MHNHFANRNDIANIFITISLKLAFSLEFNQFFYDCTSIFRNHSFVCFYVQETSGEWRNGVREKLFGGCTMCIQTNTHKLFVPCHKLWIFDQSQVSIQNAIEQTIERSLSLSRLIRRKEIEQTTIGICDCDLPFQVLAWNFNSHSECRRGKGSYLFYWTRHIDSFVEPTLQSEPLQQQ